MEDFQNNIKEWVRYDNESHRLQQELKKIREQKNNYLESIIDYSNVTIIWEKKKISFPKFPAGFKTTIVYICH